MKDIQAKNAEIDKVAAHLKKLCNMMTCREVRYQIDNCRHRLEVLTGFDKFQVKAIYG